VVKDFDVKDFDVKDFDVWDFDVKDFLCALCGSSLRFFALKSFCRPCPRIRDLPTRNRS
jgi:hypothetical protein